MTAVPDRRDLGGLRSSYATCGSSSESEAQDGIASRQVFLYHVLKNGGYRLNLGSARATGSAPYVVLLYFPQYLADFVRFPKGILCATTASVLLLTASLQSVVHLSRGSSADDLPIDFTEYYVAGRIASGEGGGKLYEFRPGSYAPLRLAFGEVTSEAWREVGREHGLDAKLAILYPPLFAVAVSPLSRLEPAAALLWWHLLSLSMLAASWWWPWRAGTAPWPVYFCSLVMGLAFLPFLETLSLGQANVLILFTWTLGTWFEHRERHVTSALFFAAGTLLKLTPALVVPLFLLRRNWKWLAAYIGFSALLLTVSVLQVGWENHRVYLTRILPVISAGVPGFNSKSFPTLLYNIHLGYVWDEASPVASPSPGLSLLLKAGCLSVLMPVLFLAWRFQRPDNLTRELVAMAAVALAISPISWRHHFVLLLLPISYLWAKLSDRDWAALGLLSACTLIVGTPYVLFLQAHIHAAGIGLVLAALVPLCTVALALLCLARPRERTADEWPSLAESPAAP